MPSEKQEIEIAEEIERVPINGAYEQQGYGGKYSLTDVAHKLDEVIEAVNKLMEK